MKKILPFLLLLLSCGLEVEEDLILLENEFFRNIIIYIEEYETPKIIDEIDVYCGVSIKLQPKSDRYLEELVSLKLYRSSDNILLTSTYTFDRDSNEIEMWDILDSTNPESIIAGNYTLMAVLKGGSEISYSFKLYNRKNSPSGTINSRIFEKEHDNYIMPPGETVSYIPQDNGIRLNYTNTNSVDKVYILLTKNGENYFKAIELSGSSCVIPKAVTGFSYILLDNSKSELKHIVYYRFNSKIIYLN